MFVLGAEYIHSDLQSMENLELKAIMSFTWFIVTYASIITCDISMEFYNPTCSTYAMFGYPYTNHMEKLIFISYVQSFLG